MLLNRLVPAVAAGLLLTSGLRADDPVRATVDDHVAEW